MKKTNYTTVLLVLLTCGLLSVGEGAHAAPIRPEQGGVPWINPAWNGAKGDGATNDTAAIQAAFGTGNRTVVFGAGTFIVSGLILQSNMKVMGQGVGVTILKVQAQATPAYVFANYSTLPIENIEVSHMTLDGNGTNQTSPEFATLGLNGATNFWFHHLEVKNSVEYCVGLEGGVIQGKLSDMVIGPCRWDGIDIKNPRNRTRVEINNVSVYGPGTAMGPNAGVPNAVCFDQGGVVKLTNVRCTGLVGHTYGFDFRRHQTTGVNCLEDFCEGGQASSLSNFYVEGDASTTTLGAGVLVRDSMVQISNGYVYGMGMGVYVESDVGLGEARDVMVSNVIAFAPLVSGFRTGATATFVSFVNCSSINSLGTGASFQAGSARFIASSAYNSAGNGVEIGGTAQHIKIEGSNISANAGAGVAIGSGTANALVLGNTIVGNGTATSPAGPQVTDLGTSSVIQDNVGVMTANGGTATVPSGSVQVVVNHGLDFTPLLSGISLTALENPTNDPGLIIADSVSATQFTIRVRSDPGVSNLDVGWRIRVKE